MKLLTALYSIHSMSGQEKKMKKFIKNYIRDYVPGAVVENIEGNLYVTKGQSETYPCLVAHLDQVQTIHDMDFEVIVENDTIFAYSPSMRRTNGLGADDKNGIWVALRCLEEYDVLKLAFFVGEEVGCVGSIKAYMKFFDDCRFVLQIDRRGSSDLITNISGIKLASDEFIHDIDFAKYGYAPTTGLMTDVEALCENGLAVSCVNMSCGYYSPHSDYESTSWNDLNKCLDFVMHIIETCTRVYPCKHEYPRYRGYGRYSGYGSFDDFYGGWGHRDLFTSGSHENASTVGELLESFDVDDQTFGEPKILHASDYPDLYDYMFAQVENYLSCNKSPEDAWDAIEADIEGSEYDKGDFFWICDTIYEDMEFSSC